METLAITFEPIGILTHSAHQNDRLNLSFVKDNHTGSQKMAINGSKTAIYFVIFISKQSLSTLRCHTARNSTSVQLQHEQKRGDHCLFC